MTAEKDHVVAGLVSKRAELAGIIDQLQRQLDQYRADLTHVDGVLRILATDLDPETIRPKRLYRRNRYFARNELSRLCLGAFRIAAGQPVTADYIAEQVMTVKGFAVSDRALRVAIADQVTVLKGLRKRGIIERIGIGRGANMEAGRRLAGPPHGDAAVPSAASLARLYLFLSIRPKTPFARSTASSASSPENDLFQS